MPTRISRPRPLAHSLTRFTTRAAMLAAIAMAGSAATKGAINWDGDATDGLWATAANWAGDAVPADTDDLVFGSGSPITIDLGADRVANSLRFSQSGFTLGAASTLFKLTNTTGNITVDSGVTGRINAVLAGTNGLTLAGGGTLTLAGTNTFTGAVTLTAGTLSVGADANLGATANGLALNGGTLATTATFTSARALSLGTGGGTISPAATTTLTLSTGISASANSLTKTGAGTLSLTAASTRTGTTSITGGVLSATNVSALGTGAVTVSGAGNTYELNPAAATTSVHAITVDNGGTFQWTPNLTLTLGASAPLSFTGTGGTLFVGGSGSTGKVNAGAGLLASASGSTVTKTGGGVVQVAGANTGFLGDLSIQAGTIEFQNVDSLGTGVKTVTVGGTGDFATGAVANRNNVILNAGGTLSANSTSANYTGTVTVAGSSTIALRQFQTIANANSFQISGGLSGTAPLTISAPAAATLTVTGRTDNGATNGWNYTGALTLGNNASLAIRTANTTAGSVTVGSPGVNAFYYNFGNDPGANTNPAVYSTDLLALDQRVFTRTDSAIGLPALGGTATNTYPIVPVPGYQYAVNDGAMFKGLLNITTAGTYAFDSNVDDKDLLIIDGVAVGNHSANNGANFTALGSINLTAGYHSIVYKYSQGTGGGYAQLRYSGGDTGGNAIAIPTSALSTGSLGALQLGALTINGTSTLTVNAPTEAPGLTLATGANLTLVSETVDNLTITGATTLNATGANQSITVTPNSGGLIFNGAIGGVGSTGTGSLTFAGTYLKQINAGSTYTGNTSVTGGQLNLNAATGVAIPAGTVTLNVGATASTANVNSINLLKSEQIDDSATLVLSGTNVGILNLGAFDETVGTLTMGGGRITGTGTLTLGNLTGSSFTGGTVAPGFIDTILGGSGTLTKSGTGLLVLSGANTYTGPTSITGGRLLVRNDAGLGAAGIGNETTISGTGQLQFGGNLSIAEAITSNTGTGVRHVGGVVTLTSPLVYGAAVSAATLTVDSGVLTLAGAGTSLDASAGNAALTVNGNGELIVSRPINVGTGSITRSGSGSLIFNYDTAGTVPAVTLTSGAIGFNGVQTGTAFVVPDTAGVAYKFNSDPGATATIATGANSTVVAGFAPNQTFLSRFTTGSLGNLVLTTDTASNLDLSAGPNVALGARGRVLYTGTLTPNGTAYSFGGSFGAERQNILGLTQPLTGANGVNVTPGSVLDVTRIANTFGGTLALNGGTITYTDSDSLGSGSVTNGITIGNGGTLRLAHTSGSATNLFSDLGYSSVNGTARVITVTPGGATIDVPALSSANVGLILPQANQLQGAAGTTLTKTGLGLMVLTGSNSFSGAIVIGPLGNQIDLRGAGKLPNASSITINQSSTLSLDSLNGLGAGRGNFAAQNTQRLPSGMPLTMSGGNLQLVAVNGATNTENLGTLTLGPGQSQIVANTNGSSQTSAQAQVTFANLTRAVGSTLRFGGNGTWGSTGNSTMRTLLTQVNGVAPTTGQILSFGQLFGTDIATYGANGVVIATYTDQATGATLAPDPTKIYRITGTAAGTVTLGTGTGGVISMSGLKFASGDFDQTLAFTTATDTLYIGTATSFGGAITAGNTSPASNTNRFMVIGAAGSGNLTAGPSGATAPQELFFHIRGATNGTGNLQMTVNSKIVDNNVLAPVTVVKDDDGILNFSATGGSTYSGGTFINRGRIVANLAGSLGTGAVNVKNAAITLPVAGTVSGTSIATANPVFTISDQSELFLSGGVAYNGVNDRFDVGPGSNVASTSATAGQGLNSLTYVAPENPFTGGGQIRLAAGAVVRSTGVVANSDIGTVNMIQGLPTNASLYFNAGSTTGDGTTLTLGAGTPWRGIGAGKVGATFTAGTIFANSDIEFNGTTADNANVAVNLGSTGTGTYRIVNNAGMPINALITGTVTMNEGSTVSMPSDLTFVVSNGSVLQPTLPNQFGSGSNVAKILVQAGGTLDPGSYAAVGANANQAQGVVYPVPGPINASQTIIESGGRLISNDSSGLGTSPVGSLQFRSGAIFDLGNTAAFLGANAGLINAGQLVFDPGTIVRLNAEGIFRLNQFVNSAPNGTALTYEVTGASRGLTEATNPMTVAAIGTSQLEIFDFVVGNGGVLTNDSVDRAINERRGRIVLNDGAALAGTNQTYFSLQEGIQVAPGANITIGSTQVIDGASKLGAVQLTGPQSNVIPNSATVSLLNGAQLAFGATNVWPDTHDLNLPFAVTSFPALGGTAIQPGNGTSLLLNTANFVEVMGALTGSGAVLANQAGAGLGVGYGATSDFTFAGVFKSTNGQNPILVKLGATKLTLTGANDATTETVAEQGTIELSGTGSVKSSVRAFKGAKVVIDNSGTAQNGRTNGAGTFWVPSGGTFNVIGNATTPVVESFANLANSASSMYGVSQVPGYTTLTVTPGVATTTVFANAAENFISGGIAQHRSGTWVLNTPTVTNSAITVGSLGQITAPGSNQTNGLVQIALPNFGANGAGGVVSGGILGSPGTIVAVSRPDFLGDSNNDGIPEGFMTQDGANLTATVSNGSNSVTGLLSTTGLAVGMPVSGTGIPANTTIASIVNGTSITLSQNANAAGTALAVVSGGMRLLGSSEYSVGFRDNMTTSTNVRLGGTSFVSGDTRVQTLTLTPGSTLNVVGTLPLNQTSSRLQLNGGGVFVPTGGAVTINGSTSGGTKAFLQAQSGSSLFLHTFSNLSLNIPVYSDNAVVKTGAATLDVGDGAFTAFRGSLQIDDGVVNLGPNNSVANVRAQNGFNPAGPLFLNGGTLNLNGNSQYFSRLENNNPLPGSGGLVTSNAPALLAITGGTASIFSGTIGGQISLDKTTNTTVTLTNDNPYAGATTIRAGTLVLRDSGRLSGTNGVEIQNSTLLLDNSYLSNVADRIPVTTLVTLKGGTINLTGAAGQVASQTFNTLTLASGLNQLTANPGGAGAAVTNIGNVVRPLASGSVLNFTSAVGFLGSPGTTSTTSRNLITNINGSALSLNDGLIGGWAIVAGSNFATYLPGQGVGAMGNTADGFQAYSSTDITTAGPTDNVNESSAARTLTASKVINSLRLVPSAASTFTLNSGVGITVDTGGIIHDAASTESLTAATNSSGNFITSNSGELLWYGNGASAGGLNIPITGAINFVKSGTGSGGLNVRPEATFTGTGSSGSAVITAMTTTAGLVVGMPVSGTGIPAGTRIQSVDSPTQITLTQTASGAVSNPVIGFGNTYTGATIVNGGTLTLNMGSANPTGLGGYTAVAVPGDLFINNATVTEANAPGQLKPTANITVSGGGRFNAVNLAGATETLGSLTALDSAGVGVATGFNTILDRSGAQFTSTVNLSSATAITTTNTNPSVVPLVGTNLGILGFTSPTTATLNINSPVGTQGLAAVGLRIDSQIGSIPAAVPEGSLIKSGSGMLVLSPGTNPTFAAGATTNASNVITVTSTAGLVPGQQVTGTNIPAGSYVVAVTSGTQFTISQNATATGTAITITGQVVNAFGSPSVLTDVFNIQAGVVRADTSGALGSNLANTTVQSGAVLLGANSANQVISGSVTLKAGATMAATLNSFTLGAATLTPANQSVLNVPSGTVNLAAYDYFLPTTNGGDIRINSRFTGTGTINIVGPQLTAGNGAGGTITFGNPILTGVGSNDFSGTINLGTNSILQNQVALIAGSGLVRSTGNALGTATINLNGGRLRFRDDATSGTSAVSNTTVAFGNNVTLLANSYIDAGRANSTDTISGNVISLGTLTVPSGTTSLTVDSSTATAAGAGAGNYQIAFSSLTGPGTLVKGGSGRLNIGSIAPEFSGNVIIAGPMGFTLAPSFSSTSNPNISFPTGATLNNLAINGSLISEASKTLNVTGTLSVNANPGNVSGMYAVTSSTVLNAGTFTNNGLVGATGGNSTISATNGFTGTGKYQTATAIQPASGGATTSNQLTLDGNFNSGSLKVSGSTTGVNGVGGANDIVTLKGSSHTFSAGVEIQSGVLRVNPAVNATSAGSIRVFGVPASTASATSAPISQVAGTLLFDSGANSVTHTGDITNNGIVRVGSGTTIVNGTISGTGIQYVPGLLEGFVAVNALDSTTARPANPGNFGIQMEPRMLQTNAVTQNALTGHTDNDTWIYTGYIKDDDGVFSFAENIDDKAAVWVDGQLVLNAANGGTSRVVSSAFKDALAGTAVATGPNANLGTPSQNFGPGIPLTVNGVTTNGWHLVEIRMNNGAGGAGPIAGNGFGANYGFGYKNGIGALDGADYSKPIDDGSGNLFVTPVGGAGQIEVAADSTLKAQAFNTISKVNFAGTNASIELTGAATSATDLIATTGGTAFTPNLLKIPAGATLNAASFTQASGGNFSVSGTSTSNVNVGTTNIDGTLSIDGANVAVTGAGSGATTGTVRVNSGNLSIPVGGSIAGSLLVSGGKTAIQGNGVLATSGFIGGGMTQSDGSVVLDGVVSGNATMSGGTLNGAGSILGSLIASGGTIDPGLSLGAAFGTLKTGDLDLQAGATLSLDLGGLPSGLSKDQVSVTGTLSLAGQLQLSLRNGYTPNDGATFFLVLNDGTDAVTGNFAGLAESSTVSLGGYNWQISYTGNGDGGLIGNDVALIAQVPEPGAIATLFGGMASLLGMRRFRRRQ